MPDIKPADLLSLFGEKTLCVLPDYKRTGLFESNDGAIAKAVYTAKVNPQNWKQKYVDQLESMFSLYTRSGLERTDNPTTFTSAIEIEMVESDNSYSLSTCTRDYNTEDFPICEKRVSYNRDNVSAIVSQMEFAKNKLKSANATGRIAKRIVDHVANWNIHDKPQTILKRLPLLFSHPEGVVLVGDTLTMGHIPDNHECIEARGQAINWQVLDVDRVNNRALVISEKVLTSMKPYNAATSDNYSTYTYSWANCDINTYLNGSFISEYGLDNVSMASVEHKTEAYTFASSSARGVSTTATTSSEKVFLLSVSEVKSYFAEQSARVAYALAGFTALWWLRSPGSSRCSYVASVNDRGYVYTDGSFVFGQIGLRPAFWVNLPIL